MSQPCVCVDEVYGSTEYNQFIGTVFGECLFSGTDYIPFALGMASMAAWVVAGVSQIWHNFQRKQVEGLSKMFVIVWLLGDSFSTLGAIFLQQRRTAILLGFFAVFNDIVLLVQLKYYSNLNKQRERLGESDSAPTADDAIETCFNASFAAVCVLTTLLFVISFPHIGGCWTAASRSAAAAKPWRACDVAPNPSLMRWVVGCLLCWSAALFFFCSRIPQVWNNFKEQSCEGLSLGLFINAIIANICFGGQFIAARVIASSKNIPFVWSQFAYEDLPFIVGSIGTLIYDVIILFQFYRYRKRG